MAEMRAGMRVWLPGPADQPFVPGACVAVEAGGQLKLKMDDGEEKSVDPSKVDVLAGNETGLTASDHCALINMNEPCVLENSRLRFLDDAIYTLVGTIMIAINPFARIDVYGPERMKLYAGKELGAHGVEAHLYGMGESAYRQMMRSQKQTALVMSGESGAGKTETARHLMNYIAWCSEQADASSAGQAGKLANMIIASSPLLEAFGNAKTVRNNNSSRFGKMMRLHFSPNGAMAGAYIKTYLLEKIRVVAITSPERSYHVFYQLLAARPEAAKHAQLASKTPAELRCTNKSTCVSIDGVDDVAGFKEIVDGMDLCGIAIEKQAELWKVLCGLILLNEVDFDADGGDKAVVKASCKDALAACEELLGCQNVSMNLTSKDSGRKSLGALKLTPAAAAAAREAAVKDIFVHCFDWIVEGINESIKGSEGAAKLPYIGLLDIFGFEVFKFNSFEQLCINFTNEKLQQFFLMSVFRAEEEEHAKEQVPLSKVEFQDNQPCIDLLEGKPSGLFLLLDTQCKTPNGNENEFCKSINATHGKHAFLAPFRSAKLREEEGFVVKHFAGNVSYHASSVVSKANKTSEVAWLDKNNDTLDVGWLQKLAHSKLGLLSGMYKADFEASKSRRGASSVGRRFLADVKNLLDELCSTRPFFIRCIKPNMEKVKKVFTMSLVLEQLRCSGLMGAVKLMQEAYPTRVPYDAIKEACERILGKDKLSAIKCHPAAFCEKVLQALGKTDMYALGQSKLFLKAGGGAFLQDLAEVKPAELATKIMNELKRSRRLLWITFWISTFAVRLKKLAFAKFIRAAFVVQRAYDSWRVKKKYALWSAARMQRMREELEAADAEALAERRAKDLADKVKSVTAMEEQAQAALVKKLEGEAHAERDAAVSKVRLGLVAKCGWSACRATYFKSRGLEAVKVEEAMATEENADALEIATKAAEEALQARVESGKGALKVEAEDRIANATEKLRGEVYEGATSDVCHEFAVRLADAKGEKPPQAQGRKRVSIMPGTGGGDGAHRASQAGRMSIGAGGRVSMSLRASIAGGGDAPVQIAKAAAAMPSGRDRARTLAGFFVLGDGEPLRSIVETEHASHRVGLTVEEWNGELVVVAIEPGSGVDADGTLALGDVIERIDGEKCYSLREVQRLLRGPPGKIGVWTDPVDEVVVEEEDAPSEAPELEAVAEEAEATASASSKTGASGEMGGSSKMQNGKKPADPPKAKNGVGMNGRAAAGRGGRGRGGRGRGRDGPLAKAQARTARRIDPDSMGQVVDGVFKPTDLGDEPEPIREGCEFVIDVLRRPLTFVLRTEVCVRMAGGEWDAFVAEVRSNRTVTYEQISEPHAQGEIGHVDLLGVLPSVTEDGEKVLQLYTRHKVIDMKPRDADVKAWQLRLQELMMTREEIVYNGWMHREKPADPPAADAPADAGSQRESTASRRASVTSGVKTPGATFVRYWFVLYANGILLYFTDDESAHIGQARGFLHVESAQLTSRAKRKVVAGDHVRILGSKSADLAGVVIREKRVGGKLKFRVQVEEASTQIDANPATLCYAFEGYEGEPLATCDARGVAMQSKLTIKGGHLAGNVEETWFLGVDTKADADGWFKALYKHRIVAPPQAPLMHHLATDPTFDDVVLASGWVDVLGWDAELVRSQEAIEMDNLAKIRNIAATILAFAGHAPVEEEDPFAFPDEEEEEVEWTNRWFVLRPSGIYFYSYEQRETEWEEAALKVSMKDVLSASSATGSDFYKSIVEVRRASGRPLMVQHKTRAAMRSFLGLVQLHCLKDDDGEERVWPRSVVMAGWLFHRAPPSTRSKRMMNAITGRYSSSSRGLKMMIIHGVQWQLRWIVLDADDDTADGLNGFSAGGVPRDARLTSFESEIAEDIGVPFALEEVKAVDLRPRDPDPEVEAVYANFALNTANAKKSWEFAARSEDEAREWAAALNGVLFKQSSKASRVVKV